MAEAIRLGRMTDTMDEGFLAEFSLKVGDSLKAGDTIAEVETDKATLPLESYYNGKILYVAAKKGDTLKIGDLIAIVGKEGEDFQHLIANPTPIADAKSEPKPESKEAPKQDEVKAAPMAVAASNGRVKASPLAKLIAKEKGVDLATISGSGEDGRIVKRDLEQLSSSSRATFNSNTAKESYTDSRVSSMRKTIARRLSESKNNAPHFYLTITVNMDKTIQFRKDLNEALSAKISFNDIVLKAVALSLRKNPGANTSWLGDTIRQYNHIHLGMAVAVDEGLVVPVIKFADLKSLTEISSEAKVLAKKATEKKLLPPEMEGSTFTISNLGMFGIDNFTAIINEPNACILAVGAIKQEPIVVNEKVEVGNIMKLTLSSDHRVVDGAVGAKLLQSLKQYLESPILMLI
jgi:pyruvate dehydrogenase E2 component (dihydrolipoamide acetyltransferase)